MNVKRYFAPTAREALRALKEELGSDAIVLSNRAVGGGVEILALPPEAVSALQAARSTPRPQTPPRARDERPAARPVPPPAAPRRFEDDDFHVSLSSLAGGNVPRPQPAATPRPPAEKTIRPFSPPRVEAADYPPRPDVDPARLGGLPPVRAAGESPRAPAAAAEAAAGRPQDDILVRELQESNSRLMAEISGIRDIIERQLAGFAWGETRRQAPARAVMVGALLEAGFSAATARQLAEAVGDGDTPAGARTAVRNALDQMLRTRASDDDLIDRGGVFALVGPTGVGKTTTTAKLAARCVVRHGANKLALITTDGYRIGAQEQLRIYGRILGVPVFSVRDGADLRQTLAELRNKHMVLIDTMGVSQRDRMVAEQVALLAGAGDVRRLLLLNATNRGDTLDDVVRAYAGPDLAGVIFSKIDEAASLAPAIDVAVRHRLDLLYVTNGQRVPEDLHLPNRTYLLHRVLREQPGESPWRVSGDEAGLMLAAGRGA